MIVLFFENIYKTLSSASYRFWSKSLKTSYDFLPNKPAQMYSVTEIINEGNIVENLFHYKCYFIILCYVKKHGCSFCKSKLRQNITIGTVRRFGLKNWIT